MPARSVCLVTLSLSEAGPGRFGRQLSFTYHGCCCRGRNRTYHTTNFNRKKMCTRQDAGTDIVMVVVVVLVVVVLVVVDVAVVLVLVVVDVSVVVVVFVVVDVAVVVVVVVVVFRRITAKAPDVRKMFCTWSYFCADSKTPGKSPPASVFPHATHSSLVNSARNALSVETMRDTSFDTSVAMDAGMEPPDALSPVVHVRREEYQQQRWQRVQ